MYYRAYNSGEASSDQLWIQNLREVSQSEWVLQSIPKMFETNSDFHVKEKKFNFCFSVDFY